MLSNAYFLAKFRFDTAENEPAKNLHNFANFPPGVRPEGLGEVQAPEHRVLREPDRHRGHRHGVRRERHVVPAPGDLALERRVGRGLAKE